MSFWCGYSFKRQLFSVQAARHESSTSFHPLGLDVSADLRLGPTPECIGARLAAADWACCYDVIHQCWQIVQSADQEANGVADSISG